MKDARIVKAGRATWFYVKPWLRKQEMELYRPGHIIALFFAGFVVGAALVGIAWYGTITYEDNHSGGGRTEQPDQNSW